ncbi:histidine kinase N-terminal 7TM domain-containing protein [Haloarchaeobius amylolyticus]|uniref:histidine kinase N-terminal 7TM domain-containing protein n=1 Tax=Haloarchaeobius amylolyticus TaxID=1198296 RepID=UPI0022716713|nr:histidine kinase N-terminal 7TM domain-containing protein [Haloarchaeobius amylolyticus]
MVIELHPYTLALVLGAVAAAGVAVRAWQYRPAAGATPLAVMMTGVTEWLVFHALEVEATVGWRKLLWADLQWLGVVVIPVAWLAFALEFTGRDDDRTQRVLAALLLEPLLAMLLLVTNRSHELLWGEPRLVSVEVLGLAPMTVATATPHAGAFAHALFSYALLFVGTVLLVQLLLQTRSLYRLQGFVVLVGVGLPWVTNVLALFSVTPLDLTPLAFVLTGVAFTAGLYRFRLLDLVPVAHDRVVANLDDAVLVVDRGERIVDANDAAHDLFGREDAALIGAAVTDVFPGYERLVGEANRDGRVGEVELDTDGERRHFALRLSGLTGGRGQPVGTIAMFHDITRQKARERDLERANAELQRTNDRLDEFASVVSHDLRNPLNVASGRLELARETGDDEHFVAIEESHDRMERIVDDLLTLAREGANTGAIRPVALDGVATDAWAVVDTGDSTVEVEPAGTIRADRQRLQQLFENLFRNAVEHNDGPVTVRVGSLSRALTDGDGGDGGDGDTAGTGRFAGFYVEDDGAGIPADERESVFDSGYSGGNGTGLGLAIVEKVAEAHGWTVTVTDTGATDSPATSGARFEFVVNPSRR